MKKNKAVTSSDVPKKTPKGGGKIIPPLRPGARNVTRKTSQVDKYETR